MGAMKISKVVKGLYSIIDYLQDNTIPPPDNSINVLLRASELLLGMQYRSRINNDGKNKTDTKKNQ